VQKPNHPGGHAERDVTHFREFIMLKDHPLRGAPVCHAERSRGISLDLLNRWLAEANDWFTAAREMPRLGMTA